MFWVYILQNPAGNFYIGHTDDLENRILKSTIEPIRLNWQIIPAKTGRGLWMWSEGASGRLGDGSRGATGANVALQAASQVIAWINSGPS